MLLSFSPHVLSHYSHSCISKIQTVSRIKRGFDSTVTGDDDVNLSKQKMPKFANRTSVASSSANSKHFLSNRFDLLQNNVAAIEQLPATNNSANVSRSPKIVIPPIVIREQSYLTVTELLRTQGITKYHLKLISIGIKIFVDDIDVYDELFNYLEVNKDKYKFYSFDVPHKTPIKVVLSGLPKLNIKDIKAEIDKKLPQHITCENIKEMHPKILRHPDHALYMVCFNRLNFNLNEVKSSIVGLKNITVDWKPYQRRPGPILCSNCQSYGHGNLKCHLKTVCRICGESHKDTDCAHLTSFEEGIYVSVKCHNCNGNHASNSLMCPKRAEFIEMRKTISRRSNPPRSKKHRNNPLDHPNLSADQFPPLREPRRFNSTPAPWAHQDPLTPHNQSAPRNLQQRQRQNSPMPDNELFTSGELLQLTHMLIESLRNCRTKIDQFRVVSELAIKFVYGG